MSDFETAQSYARDDFAFEESARQFFDDDSAGNVVPIRLAGGGKFSKAVPLGFDKNGLPTKQEIDMRPGEGTSTDPVRLYLKQAEVTELLEPEEEIELAKRIEAGDEDALEHMINANLLLVVSFAKHYQNQGLDLLDLINEGNIGLMKAAKNFDWRKGFKFSTYASWSIRDEMARAISSKGHTVKRTREAHGGIRKMGKVRDQFFLENGQYPTLEQIAEIMDLELEEVVKLYTRESDTNVVSFQKPVGSEGDTEFGEFVSVEEQGTFEKVADKLDDENLYAALALLDPEQRQAITLHYGLALGLEPMSVPDIAEYMGLTPNQVRHLVEKAKKSLKKILEKGPTKKQLLAKAQELAQ